MDDELDEFVRGQLHPCDWPPPYPSTLPTHSTSQTKSPSTLTEQCLDWPDGFTYSGTSSSLSGPQGWHTASPSAGCTMLASHAALSAPDSSTHSQGDSGAVGLPADAVFTFNGWETGTGPMYFPYLPKGTNTLHTPPTFVDRSSRDLDASTQSSPQEVTLPSPGSIGSMSQSGSRDKRARGRDSEPSPDLLLKRKRNTIAARKYRQKKVDHTEDLVKALEEAIEERDSLKLRFIKQEAETEALKSILRLREEGAPKG